MAAEWRTPNPLVLGWRLRTHGYRKVDIFVMKSTKTAERHRALRDSGWILAPSRGYGKIYHYETTRRFNIILDYDVDLMAQSGWIKYNHKSHKSQSKTMARSLRFQHVSECRIVQTYINVRKCSFFHFYFPGQKYFVPEENYFHCFSCFFHYFTCIFTARRSASDWIFWVR